MQTRNKDGFLFLDLCLKEFDMKDVKDWLKTYREFIYEKGNVQGIEKETEKEFKLNDINRFRYRTRYFTDSGTTGCKVFLNRLYRQFRNRFPSKKEKHQNHIKGLRGIYSLKRISGSA